MEKGESRVGGASGGGRRISDGAKIMLGLTMAAVVIAGLALARDVFDWHLTTPPQPTPPLSHPTPAGPVTSGRSPGPGTPATPDGGTRPGGTTPGTGPRLDTLRVEAGGASIAPLPRALAGRPEYERSVVINCPSNQGANRQSEVTYLLQKDFVDFTATVDAWFTSPDHRGSAVQVTVLVAIAERDGTDRRLIAGQQFDARMGDARPLRAEVVEADTMTLSVRCEWPDGVVILTDARLSRTT